MPETSNMLHGMKKQSVHVSPKSSTAIVCLLFAGWLLVQAGTDLHAQSIFTPLGHSYGFRTDAASNGYVDSDRLATTAVTHLTPQQVSAAQTPGIGGLMGGRLEQLDIEPRPRVIFCLPGSDKFC
jgi:hypothetical protein